VPPCFLFRWLYVVYFVKCPCREAQVSLKGIDFICRQLAFLAFGRRTLEYIFHTVSFQMTSQISLYHKNVLVLCTS